jgi:hypothetical protein
MTDVLIKQGLAKPIKRAPINTDFMGGIQLGHALEVELCSGQVIRWSKKPMLFWHAAGDGPGTGYLGLAELWPKPTTNSKSAVERVRAGSLVDRKYKAFHGRNPRALKSWEGVRMSDKWVSLGAICRLDYASDKKGRRASYTHDHGRGVKLYRLGTDSRALWVIKGGSLAVTGRGIMD